MQAGSRKRASSIKLDSLDTKHHQNLAGQEYSHDVIRLIIPTVQHSSAQGHLGLSSDLSIS